MSRSAVPLRCLAAGALVVLAACGGEHPAVDLGVDAPVTPDGLGPPVPGLGDTCPGSLCISVDACSVLDRSCTTGYCLADPAIGGALGDYCTIDCDPRPCPPGYHCGTTVGPLTSACLANAAVCGDGATERGEECDDGNTVPGDGCDDRCHLEVPPAARVSADVSLTTTELALDGGAPIPRVAVTHVASALDVTPGCGNATASGDAGVLPDGATYDVVTFHACPPFGTADVEATLAWTAGSYDVDTPIGAYQLAVCADLRFADASGCTQRYCAASGATPSSGTWTVTAADAGVHGRFDAHLVPHGAPFANPGVDASCPPVYGDALDVTGVVDHTR